MRLLRDDTFFRLKNAANLPNYRSEKRCHLPAHFDPVFFLTLTPIETGADFL